jgi:Trypsin-like peptidase domain
LSAEASIYYGRIDGRVMKPHLSSPWNNAVSLLTMYFQDQTLSEGTCFFWAHNNRYVLVTNWHNLSGRNHQTLEVMSKKTGALPDRVRFPLFRTIGAADEHGLHQVSSENVEVPLWDSAHNIPTWKEHFFYGRAVDVAVLDVTEAVNGLEIAAVNQLESDALLDPYLSQDVFVVGYPFGLIHGAPVPTWKRGTIAVDPTFDVHGLPKMLVDTATREAMSGSVVVARHTLVNQRYPKRSGGMQIVPPAFAQLDTVIGIYSGRHYPDYEKAQLGIVWKRRIIEYAVTVGKIPIDAIA